MALATFKNKKINGYDCFKNPEPEWLDYKPEDY